MKGGVLYSKTQKNRQWIFGVYPMKRPELASDSNHQDTTLAEDEPSEDTRAAWLDLPVTETIRVAGTAVIHEMGLIAV